MKTSPVPNMISKMSFSKALHRLLIGDRVRREEWPDDGTYVIIHDETLMIYKPEDEMLHPLILKTGDLTGEDWEIELRRERGETTRMELDKGKLTVIPSTDKIDKPIVH